MNNLVKNFLKNEFQIYLEGGDGFEVESGETQTFTLDADSYGDPEYVDKMEADLFNMAVEELKNSPLKFEKLLEFPNVVFKVNGTDIKVSFTVID